MSDSDAPNDDPGGSQDGGDRRTVERWNGISVIRGGGARRRWNGIEYKAGMWAEKVDSRSLWMNVATVRSLYLWVRYVIPGAILAVGVSWLLTDLIGAVEAA